MTTLSRIRQHLPGRDKSLMFQSSLTRTGRTLVVTAALGLALSLSLAACGSSDEKGSKDSVAVTLITKDSVNPFFVSMQKGAKKAAAADGVDLTIAAGKEDGD